MRSAAHRWRLARVGGRVRGRVRGEGRRAGDGERDGEGGGREECERGQRLDREGEDERARVKRRVVTGEGEGGGEGKVVQGGDEGGDEGEGHEG